MSQSIPTLFYALVVDDDPEARESLALLLERLGKERSNLKGLRVLKASSRDEALRRLEEVGVDMNAMDVSLMRRTPLALAVVDQKLKEDASAQRKWGDSEPHKEGVTFVEWLKSTLLPPRVVVMTAYAHTAETAGFLFAKVAADAYESKASSRARQSEVLLGALEDYLSVDYQGFGHD